MTRLTHLNALQALEATLRLGSMRLAADELKITPAALGQRIGGLEAYLGYPLVQRTRTGVELTPASAEIASELHQGFERLAEVAQGLKLDNPNTIHLQADAHWNECWLQPRLKGLAGEFPYLGVQVSSESTAPQRSDLVVDFASESGAGALLFKDYLAPITTPSVYRLLHDKPDNVLEDSLLLHLDIYQQDSQALNWPGWFRLFGQRSRAFDRGIRYSCARHAIDAALSSSGALLVGLSLCLNELQDNSLCLLFPPTMGAWTGYGYRVKTLGQPRPQVKKFLHWLEIEAGKTRSGIEAVLGC